MAKNERRKEIKRKLLHKYRLVILNENTFEEKISFKLNRLNVFVAGTLLTLGLIALTTLLIAFTPLREYIPGYSSTKLKKQATDLTYETDSLVRTLNYTNQYLDNIRKVLKGDVVNNKINRDSLFDRFELDPTTINLKPIKEDSILRAEVALEDKYNLFERETVAGNIIFFSPVSGSITQKFDPDIKHFALDIAAPSGTPIRAALNGTVVFADWTADTGYVLVLEHDNDFISIYKHNGLLNKSQGDVVKTGEVIATIGNTGKLTTGPHLHFELWQNGVALNPLDFIDFN